MGCVERGSSVGPRRSSTSRRCGLRRWQGQGRWSVESKVYLRAQQASGKLDIAADTSKERAEKAERGINNVGALGR